MKRFLFAMFLATQSFAFAYAADGAKKAAPTMALDERLKTCAACHGDKGQGVEAFKDYPRLAGQHADYLAKALRDYKSGARKNAIMGAQAKELAPSEIRGLAEYFSRQSGPLLVVR